MWRQDNQPEKLTRVSGTTILESVIEEAGDNVADYVVNNIQQKICLFMFFGAHHFEVDLGNSDVWGMQCFCSVAF